MSSGCAFPNLQFTSPISCVHIRWTISKRGPQVQLTLQNNKRDEGIILFRKIHHSYRNALQWEYLVETKNLKAIIFITQFKKFKDYTTKHLKALRE